MRKGEYKYWQLNDREWLYRKYWIEGWSQCQIVNEVGCGKGTVWFAFKRLGIPVRAFSEVNKGKHYGHYKPRSEEHSRKLSEANKGRIPWNKGKTDVYTEETKQKMREGRKHRRFPKHHTKPEMIFEEICKKNNLPFRYVGDGQLWIGRKNETQLNPDFAGCNGKKIAIFVNGDYWHSPLLRYNIRNSQRVDYQIRICKRYKWNPVILWESDLLREDVEQFVLAELKKGKVID